MSHADELTQFSWSIPDGFKIVEARSPDDESTRAHLVRIDGPGMTIYAPLKAHTALFKAFASVHLPSDSVEESILKFATRYGSLGGAVSRFVVIGNQVVVGERIQDWQRESAVMDRCMSLFDAVAGGDQSWLTNEIEWGGEVVKSRADFIAIKGDAIWPCLPRGDMIQAARFLLQKLVNEALSRHVTSRMLFSGSSLRLYTTPSGLVGALWLQLAQAIDGDATFSRCSVCADWFRPSRSDQKFCSPACKQADYRKRKGQGTHVD